MHAFHHRSWLAALAASGLVCSASAAADSEIAAGPAVRSSLAATGESWRNAEGGVAAPSWWNTLLDLGVECDFGRFGGPPDSSLFVQAHWVKNRDPDTAFADATAHSTR